MSDHQSYVGKAGIYKLTCNKNGKIYIGKSINIGHRLSKHKYRSKKSSGRCYFENALVKYGWNSFEVEILEIFENYDRSNIIHKDSIHEREAYYINLLKSTDKDIGYNICEYSNDNTGGSLSVETKQKLRDANLGKKLSEETKRKISQSIAGKKYSTERLDNLLKYKRNNPVSEETKQKIRQSKLDNPMSEESRKKLRDINTGKKMSTEARQKMSNAKKGIKFSEEHKNKIGLCHLGKIVSEETREKMRNSKSDEIKQKLSNLYKGKPRSQEIIDKIKRTKQRNKELRAELNNQKEIKI